MDSGTTEKCRVCGREQDGFQEFRWMFTAKAVSVKVFRSCDLTNQFDRLDRFEGRRYRRNFVPVECSNGKLCVCNIYHGKGMTASN